MRSDARRWLNAAGVLAMVALTGSAWAQGGTGLQAQIYPWDTNAGGSTFTGTYADGNTNTDHTDTSFIKPEVTRLDGPINFNYGCPNQPAPNIGCNHYNIRYIGQIEATVDGPYTFGINVDDGGALWINPDKAPDPAVDTPTIDGAWKDQGNTAYDSDPAAPFMLKAGQKVNVVFDAYQNGSGAVFQLSWTPPGGQRAIIPVSQLFPPANPDTAAPAAITDLAVTNPTATSATLTFTAPADTGTGSSGNASVYEVRYEPVPITAGNFPNGTQFTLAPLPQKAGTKESITVTGLDAGQHYYFAVAAQDAALNRSAISNVVDTMTPTLKAGGPGLLAQYFVFDSTITLPPDTTMINLFDPKNLVASDIEAGVNANYNTSRPAGVPHDYFAAMYSGQVTAPSDGDYTFCTTSDDGSRLFVSDKAIDITKDTPIVENWLQQGATEVCADAPVTMKAGTPLNFVEIYEQGNSGAVNQVRWSSAMVTKDIIPTSALTSPASATVPDTGRVTGTLVDQNGNGLAGSAINFTSADGKSTVTLTSDNVGAFTGQLGVGDWNVVPNGPVGLHTATSFQALPASPANAKVTIAKDQIASQNFTMTIPALNNAIPNGTMTLQAKDFPTAGTGWAFLQTTPDDTATFGAAGTPNQAFLKQWCDPALSTTGESKLLPMHTWLQDWDMVPGDAGGAGRNGDPDGIPDNTWWVSALHFKPSADVAKGTQFVLTAFNQDDYFEEACLNGVKIGGNTDADWSAIRTVYIPTGLLKTDADNLLVLVSYEGGGGAGFNNTTTGPTLIAYGPDMGGGGMMMGALGDLNGDGKVDIKDATISLQIAVGNVQPMGNQSTTGDANKDGKLDLKDTTLILGAAVGIRTLM